MPPSGPTDGPPPMPGGGPTGAPMTTPQVPEGKVQAGTIAVGLAMDLLENSLPQFGSETPEGKAVLQCLTTLTKSFGQVRDSGKPMIPAEIKQLMMASQQSSMTPEAMGASAPPGAGGPPMGAGGPPPMQPPMAA